MELKGITPWSISNRFMQETWILAWKERSMWKVEKVHISTNFSQIYWGHSWAQEKHHLFAIRNCEKQRYTVAYRCSKYCLTGSTEIFLTDTTSNESKNLRTALFTVRSSKSTTSVLRHRIAVANLELLICVGNASAKTLPKTSFKHSQLLRHLSQGLTNDKALYWWK